MQLLPFCGHSALQREALLGRFVPFFVIRFVGDYVSFVTNLLIRMLMNNAMLRTTASLCCRRFVMGGPSQRTRQMQPACCYGVVAPAIFQECIHPHRFDTFELLGSVPPRSGLFIAIRRSLHGTSIGPLDVTANYTTTAPAESRSGSAK